MEDKAIEVMKKIDERIKKVADDKIMYTNKGEKLRKLNSSFNIIIVILSVVAPSLVTYQTQNTGYPWLVFISIIIVAISGTTSALRSILRWNERYGFFAMTGIRLLELESSASDKKDDIINTTKDEYIYAKLSQLAMEIQQQHNKIIQEYLGNEIKIVEQINLMQKKENEKENA